MVQFGVFLRGPAIWVEFDGTWAAIIQAAAPAVANSGIATPVESEPPVRR
jgi:hypothetical protein